MTDLLHSKTQTWGDLAQTCGPNTLAEEYLRFTPIEGQQPNAELATLNEEGFREYVYAARWLLGERDLSVAKPVERLWAGIDTCAGQMLLPPLVGQDACSNCWNQKVDRFTGGMPILRFWSRSPHCNSVISIRWPQCT